MISVLVFIVALAIAGRQHVTCECLYRRSRQHTAQFGQMRASLNTAEPFAQVVAEALYEIQADEFFVHRRVRVAITGIRHGIGHGFGIDDIQSGIYGDSEPEIMDRLIGCALAGGELDDARFYIGNVGINIPEAVIALKGLRHDAARMTRRT